MFNFMRPFRNDFITPNGNTFGFLKYSPQLPNCSCLYREDDIQAPDGFFDSENQAIEELYLINNHDTNFYKYDKESWFYSYSSIGFNEIFEKFVINGVDSSIMSAKDNNTLSFSTNRPCTFAMNFYPDSMKEGTSFTISIDGSEYAKIEMKATEDIKSYYVYEDVSFNPPNYNYQHTCIKTNKYLELKIGQTKSKVLLPGPTHDQTQPALIIVSPYFENETGFDKSFYTTYLYTPIHAGMSTEIMQSIHINSDIYNYEIKTSKSQGFRIGTNALYRADLPCLNMNTEETRGFPDNIAPTGVKSLERNACKDTTYTGFGSSDIYFLPNKNILNKNQDETFYEKCAEYINEKENKDKKKDKKIEVLTRRGGILHCNNPCLKDDTTISVDIELDMKDNPVILKFSKLTKVMNVDNEERVLGPDCYDEVEAIALENYLQDFCKKYTLNHVGGCVWASDLQELSFTRTSICGELTYKVNYKMVAIAQVNYIDFENGDIRNSLTLGMVTCDPRHMELPDLEEIDAFKEHDIPDNEPLSKEELETIKKSCCDEYINGGDVHPNQFGNPGCNFLNSFGFLTTIYGTQINDKGKEVEVGKLSMCNSTYVADINLGNGLCIAGICEYLYNNSPLYNLESEYYDEEKGCCTDIQYASNDEHACLPDMTFGLGYYKCNYTNDLNDVDFYVPVSPQDNNSCAGYKEEEEVEIDPPFFDGDLVQPFVVKRLANKSMSAISASISITVSME